MYSRLPTDSATVTLDSRYHDGTLDITVQVERLLPPTSLVGASYQLEAQLYESDAPDAALVAKAAVLHSSSSTSEEVNLSIPVKSPRKWTAETPQLYTLVLVLRAGDGGDEKEVQAESCRVGFRCACVCSCMMMMMLYECGCLSTHAHTHTHT